MRTTPGIHLRKENVISRIKKVSTLFAIAAALLFPVGAAAQTKHPEQRKQQEGPSKTAPDLSRQPTLYVVGYAHLDTQWRWEYPQVIG
ncbi:MAG: hypothetical protein ACREBQ_05645, partial [Nitrososphaerales archaeon]